MLGDEQPQIFWLEHKTLGLQVLHEQRAQVTFDGRRQIGGP